MLYIANDIIPAADNTVLDVRFYSQNLPTSSGEWGQIGLGSLGSISVSLWGTVKMKIKDFREGGGADGLSWDDR